ncbi:peptidoglycan binding domain-containing protein [Kitasatospora sp. NPDC092948]|uniref:peptidoglycan binding domain-containing protein n=1 Tax=Kitasatospora sp. NPDC092948 TaxID=3364088 RepID=UPI00381E11C5
MSSRESDNAHPQPRRGGPDAYPSGTPPYGTGLPGGLPDPAAARTAPGPGADAADVPKTETTLTTRVRINIPGSRPIPPVVVQSKVKDEKPAEPAGPRHRGGGGDPVLGVMDTGASRTKAAPPNLPPEWQEPAAPKASESESTGEWFKPRQKSRQEAAPAPAPAAPMAGGPAGAPQPAPRPSGAAASPFAPASPYAAEQPPQQAAQQAPQQASLPGQQQPMAAQDPYAAEREYEQYQQQPAAAQDPYATGQQPIPGQDPYAAAPQPAQGQDPYSTGQQPMPGQDPYSTGQQPMPGQDPYATGQQPMPGQDPYAAAAPQPAQGQDPYATGQQPIPGQDPYAAAAQQPAQGQDPFGTEPQHNQHEQYRNPAQPAAGQAPWAAEAPDAARAAAQQGGQDPFAAEPPADRGGAADAEPEDTQIGGFDPITGEEAVPGGAIAADPPTTQLFLNGPKSQSPSRPAAADPFATSRPGPDGGNGNGSGTGSANGSGKGGGRFADMPEAQPFPGGPRAATPKREVPSDPPPAEAEERADKPAPKPAKSGGGKLKKLLVTGVGGVLFLGAAAYGAGLMMNQSDIPKGTTVLGTDIGGDSRDQAVTALDGSVGKAGQLPLRLKIGGQSVTMDPASAGLSFDTTATVDTLTKHSYNPVDVFSSLTGGGKAVEPQVRVDKAKLKAALDDLAAKSGQGLQEGYVRFTESGGIEVVPGKAGEGLDSTSAADKVEQAYRDRAAGKPDAEVALPLTDAQPKVGQDALQAAADTLGKQVQAGQISLTAGGKQFNFGKSTAAKALVLAPDASGQIVLKWNLDQLSAAIGTIFDKVKTTKGGQSSAITAQDVADAIGQTIAKTGKDRVYKFPS